MPHEQMDDRDAQIDALMMAMSELANDQKATIVVEAALNFAFAAARQLEHPAAILALADSLDDLAGHLRQEALASMGEQDGGHA